MLKLDRILVPVNFSAESDLALDWAIRLAREEKNASILLCNIFPRIISPVGPEVMGFNYTDYFDKEKKALEQKLKKLKKRIPKGISSTCVVMQGNAARQIESLCRQKKISLVVMTTHARRGLSHLVQGSIAEKTVRLAPCPVLVLHLHGAEAPVAKSGM